MHRPSPAATGGGWGASLGVRVRRSRGHLLDAQTTLLTAAADSISRQHILALEVGGALLRPKECDLTLPWGWDGVSLRPDLTMTWRGGCGGERRITNAQLEEPAQPEDPLNVAAVAIGSNNSS